MISHFLDVSPQTQFMVTERDFGDALYKLGLAATIHPHNIFAPIDEFATGKVRSHALRLSGSTKAKVPKIGLDLKGALGASANFKKRIAVESSDQLGGGDVRIDGLLWFLQR